MNPYAKKDLDLFTRICNYSFFRARRISENVFGIVSGRWRVFRTTTPLNPDKVRRIILGVLTLHNWLLRSNTSSTVYCDHIDPNTKNVIPGSWRQDEGESAFVSLQPIHHGCNLTLQAKIIREEFAKNLKSFLH